MSSRRVLDQFIKTCEPVPSACEACGQSFACGAGSGACWCGEIELSDAVRAELRTRYGRCLCRACLEKLAAGEKLAAAPGDDMIESGQGGSTLGTSR
jgi:hypothetical protein